MLGEDGLVETFSSGTVAPALTVAYPRYDLTSRPAEFYGPQSEESIATLEEALGVKETQPWLVIRGRPPGAPHSRRDDGAIPWQRVVLRQRL